MKRLLLACLLPLLMAASCDQTKPSTAIDVGCKDICFQACAPLTAWDGTRDDDKRLTALMDAHDAEHSECDTHRAACVACINTARAARAIQ